MAKLFKQVLEPFQVLIQYLSGVGAKGFRKNPSQNSRRRPVKHMNVDPGTGIVVGIKVHHAKVFDVEPGGYDVR